MEKIELLAPAKLNLSLDIVGKRQDGYHLLETVMQTISLFDTVQIERADGRDIAVTCSKGEIPQGEGNIAYRAAKLFFSAVGQPFGIKIHIEKQIPSQAGMGGGSADAAAVLVGLNQLCGSPLPQNALLKIGEQVGADVPFCIAAGTAYVTGIGEEILPMNPLKECFFVVVKPSFQVSTAEAYRKSDSGRMERHPQTSWIVALLNAGNYREAAKLFYNVFEEVTAEPELSKLLSQMLCSGAAAARMTGSGSAVFAFCEKIEEAERVAKSLKKEGYQPYITTPVSNGPTFKEKFS